MLREREFLIIRYLILVFLLIETIFMEENNIVSIVLIFLYVISNQVRLYILKNRKQKLVSLGVDIILIILLSMYSNIEIMACGLILMMDSMYIESTLYRKIFNISIIVSSLSLFFDNVSLDKIYRALFLIIFSLLVEYIVKENKQKLNAQELYDKLRISQEELKKANRNLESYATTIEELTLLKERNRISREIHDSVGHALSTALIQLNAMEQLAIKGGDNTLSSLATGLRSFIKTALDDVRVAVRKLKPSDYSDYEGIIRIENLFKDFQKLTNVNIKLTISRDKWSLKSNENENIYRIFQESLSNSVRHGKATEISVLMNFDDNNLIINFKDNGRGTDKIQHSGLGLNNIKDRVLELKGEVEFSSKDKGGFITKIIIPRKLGGDV